MSIYLTLVAGLLLFVLLSGLVRVIHGPTAADRMLVAQLFGTSGVALLMLLSVAKQQTALLDAALVLALLAPLTLITFVTLASKKP